MKFLFVAAVCSFICAISCLKLDTLSKTRARQADGPLSCYTCSGGSWSECGTDSMADCNAGEHCYSEKIITWTRDNNGNPQSATTVSRGCTDYVRHSIAEDGVDESRDTSAENCYETACNTHIP